MNSPNKFVRLFIAFACTCLVTVATVTAAEAKKDAQSVLNELRLKKWTKDLTLTEEQQKKVQGLFDDEQKEIAKVDGLADLDINQRRTKVDDLRRGTYDKMKPLLTPEQLETFEKLLAKAAKPKKKTS